jgi:hypothetical protein
MHLNPTPSLRFFLQFALGRLTDLSLDDFSVHTAIAVALGLFCSEAACWDLAQQVAEDFVEQQLRMRSARYNQWVNTFSSWKRQLFHCA